MLINHKVISVTNNLNKKVVDFQLFVLIIYGSLIIKGQISEFSCKRGFECSNPSIPRNCPRGSYNNKTDSTNCTACPIAKYCPEKGTISPIICPIGTIGNVYASITEVEAAPVR